MKLVSHDRFALRAILCFKTLPNARLSSLLVCQWHACGGVGRESPLFKNQNRLLTDKRVSWHLDNIADHQDQIGGGVYFVLSSDD